MLIIGIGFFIAYVNSTLGSEVTQSSILLLRGLNYHMGFPRGRKYYNRPTVGDNCVGRTVPKVGGLVTTLRSGSSPVVSPTNSYACTMGDCPACLTSRPR